MSETPYADQLGVMRDGVAPEVREIHALQVEVQRLHAVAAAERLRDCVARTLAIAAMREARS